MGRIRYLLVLSLVLFSFQAMGTDSSALKQAHIDHRKGYAHHIQKDYETALIWYEKSASAGLAKSEYAIGRILAFDREEQHEYKKALPYILRAAEPRSKPQGYGFIQSQNYAQNSLNWYCKNGAALFPDSHPYAKDPKCWHGRAKALMFGWFGMKKDYPSARVLLEKAIAANHVEAQATLDRLAIREVHKPKTSKLKPMDWRRTYFILFMLLLASMVFRSMRLGRILFGVLYKSSS